MKTSNDSFARGTHAIVAALVLVVAGVAAQAQTVVVPAGLAAREGTGSSGILNAAAREQTVYAATNFPAGQIVIQQLMFRPNVSDYLPGAPFSATISNLQVTLSTTQKSPGGLSATFSDNAGPDATVVVNGAVNLSSAFTGPATGPKAFDIVVPLSQPFTYNPAAGNLLVDIQNVSGNATTPVDAEDSTVGAASRVIAGSPLSATGSPDSDADVLQLVYSQEVNTNSGSCSTPPSGMVGWWRGEGDAMDSVGGNNGTLNNGVGFAAGEVGTAFSFNGINQFVQVSNSPALNLTNALTLEAWVKVAGYSANDSLVILSKDCPFCFVQYALGMDHVNGKWVFDSLLGHGSSYTVLTGATAVQLGVWYHVAMTFDGATLKLYVNGVADGSIASIPPLPTSQPFMIGGLSSGPFDFYGLVDEVSIYNRALTALEVQGIFNAGSAGKCAPSAVPPQISSNPVDETIYEGQTASFTVGATGSQPLSYQWYLDGTNALAGATNSELDLANVQASQAGSYSVAVSNGAGSTNSQAATLTVNVLSGNCLTPPSGLVAWWRGEGDATDSIGGNNGTLNNGVSFVNGEVGSAFSFNGVNQYVEVPATSALNLTNDLTLEAWVNVAGYSANDSLVILSKDCPFCFVQYALGMDNVNGHWVFDSLLGHGGSYTVLTGATAVQLGTWYHVAMTFDGSNLDLYVNGTLDGTVASAPPLPTSQPFMIGGLSSGPFDFHGLVDEVSIYNRALAAGEVQSVFEAGNLGKCAPTNSTPPPPPPSTNSCVTPPSGLVGWWRGESNTVDSVAGNNGTTNAVGFATGEVGTAFSFNGVNQYVEITNSPALDLTNDFTLEAWVNLRGYSANDSLVIMGKDCPFCFVQYALGMDNVNGQWVFDSLLGHGNSYTVLTGATTVQADSWYHVAMTFDGSTLKLYVNGALDGSVAGTPPSPTTQPFVIGGLTSGPFNFNGLVDEVSVYNRALTDAEVAQIYGAGVAGKCTSGPQVAGRTSPDLKIAASANRVGLSWPSAATPGAMLEASSNLIDWHLVTPSLTTNLNMVNTQMGDTGHGVFFRLRRPQVAAPQ